jgi:2-polyprenyl-3-methyl-5-hydroxy-6-metoxy-1,4-benzoquinol methylase
MAPATTHDPAQGGPCPLCGSLRTAAFAEVDDRRYHRCDRCRLTFLDPAQRPGRVVERATYDLHENDPADPRYRAFLDRLVAPLLARLAPGMVGLDFGCGPGPAISAMLAEHGIEAVDYDPLYRPTPGALDGRYDFVTCTEVVEHLHAPATVLETLDGLLRPGGWIGVMTEMLEDDAGFAGWWYRRDPTHVAFFRRATMGWIAAHFGWDVTFPARSVTLFQKAPAIAGTDPGAARRG